MDSFWGNCYNNCLGKISLWENSQTHRQKIEKRFHIESKKAEEILLDLNLARDKVSQLENKFKTTKDKIIELGGQLGNSSKKE